MRDRPRAQKLAWAQDPIQDVEAVKHRVNTGYQISIKQQPESRLSAKAAALGTAPI